MDITGDTWAIVVATAIGPVAAVAITFWRDDRKSRRERRLFVFRTLMATRRQLISNEHVGAINLIEVEFYRCVNVEQAWKAYNTHLNTAVVEGPAWVETRDKLLAKMLAEMSRVLGFRYDAIEIYRGGYAPQKWTDREAKGAAAVDFILQLADGTKAIPISMKGQIAPEPGATEKL